MDAIAGNGPAPRAGRKEWIGLAVLSLACLLAGGCKRTSKPHSQGVCRCEAPLRLRVPVAVGISAATIRAASAGPMPGRDAS